MFEVQLQSRWVHGHGMSWQSHENVAVNKMQPDYPNAPNVRLEIVLSCAREGSFWKYSVYLKIDFAQSLNRTCFDLTYFVATREQLAFVGADIFNVSMLQYPFSVSPARLEQNKPCRYSKLQLWNMTQFEKIVYLDSDMLAVQNFDSIFEEYDDLSAAGDTYPGVFNAGTLVLKPNRTTYKRLLDTYKSVPSYNVGDQGFLNWFFGEDWKSNYSHQLPLIYNVMPKYIGSVIYQKIYRDIKVMHFTAETKPWNIHYSKHKEWRRNSDPVLYYKWISTRRAVDKLVKKNSEYVDINEAIDEKCKAEVKRFVNSKSNIDNRFPAGKKFTILISTFNREKLAAMLVNHYSKSKFVDQIYVIWHNPNKAIPSLLSATVRNRTPPVTILK